MTKNLNLIFGTHDPILAVRISFVFLVALLGAVIGVVLLRLPLWTLGILALGLLATFRVGVPLGLYVVHTTQVPQGRNPTGLSGLTGEEITSMARDAKGMWSNRLNATDAVEWVREYRDTFPRTVTDR